MFKTTHVGSLPRPDNVCAVLQEREEKGEPPSQFESVVKSEVDAVVRKQVAIGIDHVSDGEYSKIGYANYIKDRLTGFSGDSPRIPGADLDDFPNFLKMLARWREGALPRPTPCCTGEITVKDTDQLKESLNNYLIPQLAQNRLAQGDDPKGRAGCPCQGSQRSARRFYASPAGPTDGSGLGVMFFRDRTTIAVEHALIPNPSVGLRYQIINQRFLNADLKRLRSAVDASGAEAAFVNAASPGVIALFQANEFYPSRSDYLQALATAMAPEYRAIVDAGFYLQVDCPDLGMGRHTTFKHADDAEFLAAAEEQIEVLNTALDGIPEEKLRLHICWGNYEGPHTRDIGLDKVIQLLFKVKPKILLFEAANPRHAHEWEVFESVQVPENKILCPGVIDSTSNYVEHPRLVTQRLKQFARIVGPERVMAGTDCGFGTFAGDGLVEADVAFAKLDALAQGAEIARKSV